MPLQHLLLKWHSKLLGASNVDINFLGALFKGIVAQLHPVSKMVLDDIVIW